MSPQLESTCLEKGIYEGLHKSLPKVHRNIHPTTSQGCALKIELSKMHNLALRQGSDVNVKPLPAALEEKKTEGFHLYLRDKRQIEKKNNNNKKNKRNKKSGRGKIVFLVYKCINLYTGAQNVFIQS